MVILTFPFRWITLTFLWVTRSRLLNSSSPRNNNFQFENSAIPNILPSSCMSFRIYNLNSCSDDSSNKFKNLFLFNWRKFFNRQLSFTLWTCFEKFQIPLVALTFVARKKMKCFCCVCWTYYLNLFLWNVMQVDYFCL